MELHELRKLQIKVSRGHFPKRHWPYTGAHVNLGHSLGNVAGKPWHIGSWTIIVDSLIKTPLPFDEDVIGNTLVTGIILWACDTVFHALLAVYN